MERWYDIEGYEDYKISNLGNIKSIKKGKEERILKPYLYNRQYQIDLSKNGKTKKFKIAVLVLENIRKVKYKKYYIAYKDNDNSNNADSNIIVIKTAKERIDYLKERDGYKRLTKEEVELIYNLSKSNGVGEIARSFNLSDTQVSNIKGKRIKIQFIYTFSYE